MRFPCFLNLFFTRARYYSIAAVIAAILAPAVGAFAASSAAPAENPLAQEKRRVARKLASENRPGAKDKLLEMIDTEPDKAVKADLVAALAVTSPEVASLEPLLEDSDAMVRAQAVQALGAIGGEAVARDLEGVLLADKSTGVRLSAAFWLGQIKDPASVPVLAQALLAEKNVSVRAQVARSLRQFKSKDAKDALKAVENDKDDRIGKIAREK